MADAQLQTLLVVIALDVVLGVLASFRLGTFRLAYLANFARNDLLGKVVPFLILDAAAQVAGGLNIIVSGLDLTNIAHGVFVLLTAAMIGSILGSLRDLGLASTIPAALGSATATPVGPVEQRNP